MLPRGAGVSFPRLKDARPTTPTGRAILAAAARATDEQLADRIAASSAWRSEYTTFVRALTAASARSATGALAIAESGLRAMHEHMVVEREGEDFAIDDVLRHGPQRYFGSRTVQGTEAPVTELRVPYRGQDLHGEGLLRQLDRWTEAGVVEPSFAVAVRRVVEHPEWLSLPGRRVALIGAGAEMGPLGPLSAWGAHTIALDVPHPETWDRLEHAARDGAGTMTLPVAPDGQRGVDLLRALPETRAWLNDAPAEEQLVLGMYAYADGGLHVRVTAAADTLAIDLLRERPDTALAYLATPTDAFVVPDDVMAQARNAYNNRGLRRIAQAPLRAASAGRLFAPAYADGVPVADVLVPQQGPNYALAKRLQRWRGVAARGAGHTVSFNVAPATWTRSVTKNRMLAAAYAGAHHFGIEIFQADTTRVLMAALLVHDLHQLGREHDNPEHLFCDQAAHGGLWRAAYEPRSVLGLAAVTGLPHALRR